MTHPPFIVYGLPRSRTYWLSHFLSYGDTKCYHEACMYMRSIDDMRSFLSQDNTGAAETAAAPGWRLIHHYRPDIRAVVVRRPVEDVVKSLLAVDMSGVARYDVALAHKSMSYLDRYLDQIEANVPGAVSVRFDDLADQETCRRVFEHCLPYRFDAAWWEAFAPINLQINSRAMMRYRFAHRPQIDAFKAQCWAELRKLAKSGAFPHE